MINHVINLLFFYCLTETQETVKHYVYELKKVIY